VTAKSLPDLARAAAASIDVAEQGARDTAEHVRHRRFDKAAVSAAILTVDRDEGAALCEALAARLTVDLAVEVRSIGQACRLGCASWGMGQTLLRIAAHADADERDTEPPSDPAAVSPTAVREVVETLVGEAPVLVPGADYIVRMDRDGTPIWWVSQDVLAHWTPDRSRASRLTIEGADGLADAYAAEGATVERRESVDAAELAAVGLAEGYELHFLPNATSMTACGLWTSFGGEGEATVDQERFDAAPNRCAACAEAAGGR